MGNRKQPFGYKIKMGQIVLHPQEAEVVRHIFQQYTTGATYNSLVAELKEQPIHYDEQKPWNKNMIARILEDKRYTGVNGYPAIISNERLDAVAQKRSAKQRPIQKTEAQKVLRRLSGHTATPKMEQQVLDLLGSLIGKPEKIRYPGVEQKPSADTLLLERKLNAALNTQPIDEDAAKEVILSLAAVQYHRIGNEEYETVRLQRIFGIVSPMRTLDAELLQTTVSAIQLYGDRSIKIRLKNGQVFGRSEIS